MIVSDLLDLRAETTDGETVGWTVDARLVLDGPLDGPLARPRLVGLVVSPHTRTSFLGFERAQVPAPWLIARPLRRLHRGTFLVRWEDIARLPLPAERRDPDRRSAVVLRAGYGRHDPRL